MPVPFKVKALFEYNSSEPDDLNFGDGQIITVIEDDDEDWYTGEYINGAGEKVEGIFPRNFVEKYEPVIPSRPARGPRRPIQPEVAESLPAAEPVPTSPPAQQQVKETEPEPIKDVSTSRALPKESEPAPISKPAPTESKTTKQAPPPVAEKPTSSSFRDRIAAFNKPAAAPVAPFKPQGAGSGGFVKKAFVAPPPSRNAFVPPPREAPPPKVYRREEDPEVTHEAEEEDERPMPAAPAKADHAEQSEEDDQPQPTSLKDRIALLQKQQMEQAARQADAAKKKEKPKRPSKPRVESSEGVEESTEAPIVRQETDDTVGKHSVEASQEDAEEAREHRQSIERTGTTMTLPQPSRELVSDTNDADDSGAEDTEDAQEISTEEERVKPKPISKAVEGNERAEPKETAAPSRVGDDEDPKDEDEEDEEEEEDPEARRKRELRERMAKMSGGMGMMGMLGGGMPAARKAKPAKEEKTATQAPEEEVTRAPPVPIMALPGMSTKQKPKELDTDSDQDDTAHPTPMDPKVSQEQDDYISHQPVRRSTDRSLSERAPPPPPPSSRPEPPTSPGSRPVPPPPPPSKAEGDLMFAQQESDDGRPAPPPASTRPLPPPPPTGPRGAPPPPPAGQAQPSAAGESPTSPPPVPMSPGSSQTRAPPPPPPGQPPSRRSTVDSSRSKAKEDSEDEVTEYDGDYDTDIASSAKHKDALKAHNRDSSFEEELLTDDATKSPQSPPARAVPPVPQAAPRDLPPPPPPTQAPSKPSRKSTDAPRAAPPPIPAASSPTEDNDYDPYRYTAPQHGLPGMVSALRSPTEDLETDEMYDATPQTSRAPPPPPTDRAAPPPPPPADRGIMPPSDDISMSGALTAPEQRNKPSFELARSSTASRRSGEVPRPSLDKGFIATDLDLAPSSMWWTQENTPPPALQGRSDVLWEVESSTSQKRGGKTSVTRDVYILYQDYSQTTVNATFDLADPTHVSFEQTHERPPMPPRKDQLENASEAFGAEIARTAEKTAGSTVGEGSAHEFVSSLLRPLSSALMPVGTRAYGALVYANLANASTQQMDEIRPGDIVTFRNAKFAGHKGTMHQKYSMDAGKPEHVGVVLDWDGTKKKIRAWEQGREEKGKKNKVREESYRVSDLKSGEVRVWRVMPRSYVQWSDS